MGALKITPSPFEQFASDRGYNITPAVSPTHIRVYADRQTQAVYEAWIAGKQHALTATIAELKQDATGLAMVWK